MFAMLTSSASIYFPFFKTQLRERRVSSVAMKVNSVYDVCEMLCYKFIQRKTERPESRK
jgi:uncharacterized protein YutE (UPF0331/DUF86 family)